jgi:segregation and condensation protein B
MNISETPPENAAMIKSDVLPAGLMAAIEAVLMVAERPIEPRLLAQLVETSVEAVEATCADLDATYREQGRGFVLARVAGGYRFQSHPEQAAYVERFVLEGQSSRLSAAALETLAIVAYKQPISRAQVAAIRGVSVDAVMRTLTQRGYIAEVSRDSGPGQAVMYGTTALFLERLNINSIVDLPELGGFVPSADVVEALEHGLRFDPAELEPTAETNDPPEHPLVEQSADEVIIDLRDSVTGYVESSASEQE